MKRHIRKLRNSRFSELFRSFLRDVEARRRRSIYSCGGFGFFLKISFRSSEGVVVRWIW